MSGNVAATPLYDLLQALKQEIFKDLRVSLVGKIAAVNTNGTVDADVSIMQNVSQRGLAIGLDFVYPRLSSCPLISNQGGGVGAIMPVKVGDECWISFSDRCIDAWFQSGGPAPLPNFRMHDITDGFVTVGPNSLANPMIISMPSGVGGICETKASAPNFGARVTVNPTTHKIAIATGAAGVSSLFTALTALNTALAALTVNVSTGVISPASTAAIVAAQAQIAAVLE